MKKLITIIIFFISSTAFAQQNIIITGADYPPYLFVEDGVIKGIDIDIADHIFTNLGVEYEFRVYPWIRCWRMLEEGDADIGLSVSNQLRRTLYVYFPETAVWTADFVAFIKHENSLNLTINSLENIKESNLKVGVVNGNSYFPELWEIYPFTDSENKKYHSMVEPATTIEQNFKKLIAGRIDIFIIPETIGTFVINKMGLKSEVKRTGPVFFSKPYPTVFSRKSGFSNSRYPDIKSLMNAYNSELKRFKKTDTYKAIFNKYINN